MDVRLRSVRNFLDLTKTRRRTPLTHAARAPSLQTRMSKFLLVLHSDDWIIRVWPTRKHPDEPSTCTTLSTGYLERARAKVPRLPLVPRRPADHDRHALYSTRDTIPMPGSPAPPSPPLCVADGMPPTYPSVRSARSRHRCARSSAAAISPARRSACWLGPPRRSSWGTAD